MTVQKIELIADERGYFLVDTSFPDENGNPATPDTMTWRLVNEHGQVVNSRSNVAIAAEDLGTTITVELEADDLKIGDGEERYITFVGTYTSTLGSDKPLVGEGRFLISDLKGISS